MKVNNKCVRKVLMEIEKIPFGETLTVAKLQEIIPEYSIEEVMGTVTVLNREHYVTVLDKMSYDDNDVLRDHKIKNLTEKGYKNLDLIRDDETWKLLQDMIPNFDEISIFLIFDIANKIVNYRHNKLFNLPDDMLNQNM